MDFTPDQIERHNRLYEEAWKLIKGEILLDGQPLHKPGWFVRRRLKKAQSLFEATLAINAAGWNAMFAIGKIEQRLGNLKAALDWMLRAREFVLDNTSLAKETSLMASQLGMHEDGARIADEAIALKPDDAALIVNSGLAHICAGHFKTALERFQEAARIEPDVSMNARLAVYTEKVISGEFQAPESESDIARRISHI